MENIGGRGDREREGGENRTHSGNNFSAGLHVIDTTLCDVALKVI